MILHNRQMELDKNVRITQPTESGEVPIKFKKAVQTFFFKILETRFDNY